MFIYVRKTVLVFLTYTVLILNKFSKTWINLIIFLIVILKELKNWPKLGFLYFCLRSAWQVSLKWIDWQGHRVLIILFIHLEKDFFFFVKNDIYEILSNNCFIMLRYFQIFRRTILKDLELKCSFFFFFSWYKDIEENTNVGGFCGRFLAPPPQTQEVSFITYMESL